MQKCPVCKNDFSERECSLFRNVFNRINPSNIEVADKNNSPPRNVFHFFTS